MNLFADESVDGPIVTRLRDAGHEVGYVAEMASGVDDDAVLDHAFAVISPGLVRIRHEI